MGGSHEAQQNGKKHRKMFCSPCENSIYDPLYLSVTENFEELRTPPPLLVLFAEAF